jgi:microcompartment protein CcmL/EutN
MAIGIIEIQNLVNGYLASDQIMKMVNCKIIHSKKALGGRLITVVFEGTVSDLSIAIDEIKNMYQETTLLKVAEVIANPPKELMMYFEKGVFQ